MQNNINHCLFLIKSKQRISLFSSLKLCMQTQKSHRFCGFTCELPHSTSNSHAIIPQCHGVLNFVNLNSGLIMPWVLKDVHGQ